MVTETIIIENGVNLEEDHLVEEDHLAEEDHLVEEEVNPNPKKSLGGKILGVKNRYKHLFVE